MMKTITLKAKTKHGKDRINQHGAVWEIERENTFRGQPAWGLKSLNATMGGFSDGVKRHDGRWVLKENDPNFEIIK